MISAEAFLEQYHRMSDTAQEQDTSPARTSVPPMDDDTDVRKELPESQAYRGRKQTSHASSKRQGRGFGYKITQHPEDEEACKEAALYLLDAAARSSGTLRDKLAERGFMPEVIDAVVVRLEELHLIDDEAYARSVIRACVHRNMGQRGAVMELVRKGVDRALAQRVAQQAAQEGVFEDAAWELGRSIARKTQGLDLAVRKRRLWSAAGRKGHDADMMSRVAATVFNDMQDNLQE